MQRLWERVYLSSLKFLFPLSTRRTYAMIVEEAKELVGAKYGSLFLEEEDGLKRMHTSSEDLQIIEPRKGGVTQEVYETGKTIKRTHKQLIKDHKEFEKLDVGEDLSLSLTYNQISLGVLSVISNKGQKFTYDDIELLNLFAPLAMIAIRKALLHEELQNALKSRDLFISLAAHELKSPLTSILARTQMLMTKKDLDQNKMRMQLEKLVSEEMRLNKLITDFLEVNRIKMGSIKFEMGECDLGKVTKKALKNFSYMYPERVVEFNRNDKSRIIVKGDEDKLIQAIVNVMTNAAKYSESSKPIKVELIKEDKWAKITIKDEGVGIPKDELPKITEQFYRAGNIRKSGMGLGLYLVSQIVRAHRGKIKIWSKINKGTEVSIILPKFSDGKI